MTSAALLSVSLGLVVLLALVFYMRKRPSAPRVEQHRPVSATAVRVGVNTGIVHVNTGRVRRHRIRDLEAELRAPKRGGTPRSGGGTRPPTVISKLPSRPGPRYAVTGANEVSFD